MESTPALKKIPVVVDLLEIADAMENHGFGDENMSYLDIETGEVVFVASEVAQVVESGESADSLPEWQREEVEIAKHAINDDIRFVSIPHLESSTGFRFMEAFVDQLRNERVSAHLAQALRRSRPFRGFKDVLSDYPEIESQWYAFKSDRMRKEVAEFLASIQHERIELALPTKP